MSEPMTDKRLAEIEHRLRVNRFLGPQDAQELLAEVRRLRAQRDYWAEVSSESIEWADAVLRLQGERDALRAELDAARRPSAVEELVEWAGRERLPVLMERRRDGDYEASLGRVQRGLRPSRTGPTAAAAIEALLAALRDREGSE